MREMITTNLPVFIIIAPLFVSFILPTLSKRIKLVENLVISVEILGIALAVYLVSIILAQRGMPLIYQMGGWSAPWGIELKAGSLGAFFALAIAIVGLPVALFSKGNLSVEVGAEGRTARYYTLYLLLIGALTGMALTNDLFNVYVLVEVATLSCVGLVSSQKRPQAAKAAFRYLILATIGSAFVLGGIGFIYIITGHLNMGFASQKLSDIWQNNPRVVWTAFSFMLVGFGVKSAVFPLHIWLPDAHSVAPAPASAVLSGLAVKGYLFCLLKVLYFVFGPSLMQVYSVHRILVLAGMIAIVAGSILALAQSELKRRLAFSTVAQVGYIILGFGLVNTKGLAGSLFYLLSHAVIKSALFLSAGAIVNVTGKKHIKDLAGIGKKMPVTMAAFTISSLGLVGIPLLSGFIGKWNLLLGSLETENLLPVIVIIAGSVFCAAYLFPVIRIAYFEPAPDNDLKDPGLPQKIALILLSIMIIVLGTVPGSVLELANRAAAELLAVL
ncbi:MAG: monovalent cation/H+ antiporter subunit D family protein [Clostridiaceae bacterium]|nr:monovalent cation/H+ antiporter subunit D family protein [Clostridiaceae bacterium]